jgi:phage gpG-like protein
MGITGELVNFAEFTAKVTRALNVVSDLSPVFLVIANDWYKDNEQIFDLQSEGQYEDLSPDYADRKESMVGFVYPILKFDGWLEASITQPGSDGSFCVIGKKSLTLGTEIPYAIYHQSSAPRSKMPYRPMIFNKHSTGGFVDIYGARNARYSRALETYVKDRIARSKRGQ